MGLSFRMVAGFRQRSHSQVWVPRGSWPYFTLSDLKLSQPGRPRPRIYIPQEYGGRVTPPGTPPPTTGRATVEVFEAASTRKLETEFLQMNIYELSSYVTGNTLHLRYKNQHVLILFRKQSLFTVRTIRNTQIHSVGRMQSFNTKFIFLHILEKSKSKSKSKSKLLYDWRFTANQFVLASSPLRLTTRIIFPQLNPCDISPYVTSSLTRRWICLLWICLASRQVYISHMYELVFEKFLLLHYAQVLCQYRLCRVDYAYLTYLMLQRKPGNLNRRKLHHRQV
jgi:hypothetical protein